MDTWKKLPIWFKGGVYSTAIVIILEAIYMTAVLIKAAFVLYVFPLHIIALFPVMLIVSIFKSPAFLVNSLIPQPGGLFLVLIFWFVIGSIIGLIIDALQPHYAPPSKPKSK